MKIGHARIFFHISRLCTNPEAGNRVWSPQSRLNRLTKQITCSYLGRPLSAFDRRFFAVIYQVVGCCCPLVSDSLKLLLLLAGTLVYTDPWRPPAGANAKQAHAIGEQGQPLLSLACLWALETVSLLELLQLPSLV